MTQTTCYCCWGRACGQQRDHSAGCMRLRSAPLRFWAGPQTEATKPTHLLSFPLPQTSPPPTPRKQQQQSRSKPPPPAAMLAAPASAARATRTAPPLLLRRAGCHALPAPRPSFAGGPVPTTTRLPQPRRAATTRICTRPLAFLLRRCASVTGHVPGRRSRDGCGADGGGGDVFQPWVPARLPTSTRSSRAVLAPAPRAAQGRGRGASRRRVVGASGRKNRVNCEEELRVRVQFTCGPT